MRHKKVKKRIIYPDKLYNSVLVTKMINNIMNAGKKSVAEKIVYGTLSTMEQKEMNALDTLEKAMQNIMPKLEIKARRIGGANYQVPIEVRGERKVSLAIRWLIAAAEKRSNKEFKTFSEKLTAEILDAMDNKGEAIKKRDMVHKQAEANKAFAHFRW